MFHERRKSHELSDRHYRQVLCRSRAQREQMQRLWAITWRPGQRDHGFLNNLFRPLGAPSMMVQVSHTDEHTRDAISLFGIGAQARPQDGSVSYDELKLRHCFHRMPFVGARGLTLDPSEDGSSPRGNESWVRLALDVDNARCRSLCRGPWPTIPELPRIYFGYNRKENAPFEVTPALIRLASRGLAAAWSGKSLQQLGHGIKSQSAAEARAFEELSEETKTTRLQTAWEHAFIPPTDAANNTRMWLLPQELTHNVYASDRIFEYFGDLVGVHVSNPARQLLAKKVPNPAAELAAAAGFDLAQCLATLASTREGEEAWTAIEERLIGLIPRMRDAIGTKYLLSDQLLLDAICRPDSSVAVHSELGKLPAPEQLQAMRAALAPHIADCCSDTDLLNAVQDPHGPLSASGRCRIQVLKVNMRSPLQESLSFSSDDLCRDRIAAGLWHPLGETVQKPPFPSKIAVECASLAV